jgi:sugar lactone lactonase YvrE
MKIFVSILLLLSLAGNAFGQSKEVYVVDIGPDRGPPWQILKYDENGQNPEVFIDAELNRPQDIVFLESRGIALVSNLFSGRITRYDAETGEYIDDFASGIGQPTRMKIGTDDLLYVLQWAGNGKVWRYDLDGNFVDEFTTVGVSNSIGMDWDSQGNLYVASFDGRNVRMFDSSGNDLGLFVTTGLQGPTNIWFEESGELMVVDWNGQSVKRFNTAGVFQGSIVLGLSEPEGVDFLDNGDFLIGNGGTSSVRQYKADGSLVKDFVTSGLGGLAKPNAVRIRRMTQFQINAGLNDAWVNDDAAFQGLLTTVFPESKLMFLAWFTFDSVLPPDDVTANLGSPDQRWITALGSYDGNRAELKAELTTGGKFNTSVPLATQDTEYGTINIEFSDCTLALVEYDFPAVSESGSFTIHRAIGENIPLCEALSTE